MTTRTPGPGPSTTSTENADRLAKLVATIRPDWDAVTVRSALVKVADRPLAAVTLAAVTAATTRPDQRPAIIAEPGPHWDPPTLDAAPTASTAWCAHGRPLDRHCPACAPEVTRTGPTPEQRAAMRAALTQART